MFRVWYSTQSFADFIVNNTTLAGQLQAGNLEFKKIYESDASNSKNFHTVPTHIKNILYLDSPDIIVEKDTKPIFTIESSKEAGTGHNAFQRFARIAASVENNVPAFYIYPEAVLVTRRGNNVRWDQINPNIFKALENVMRLYGIPAFLYYFPSAFRNEELLARANRKGLLLSSNRRFLDCPTEEDEAMSTLFDHINVVLDHSLNNGDLSGLLRKRAFSEHQDWMQAEFHRRGGSNGLWSPLTSTTTFATDLLLNHLQRFAGRNYAFTDFLRNREETVVYGVDAKFRGDPYPGALAAIDYLVCRQGKTYEERDKNLIMAWGNFELLNDRISITGDNSRSVNRFVEKVQEVYRKPNRLLLGRSYSDLRGYEIPRYFMQVRFGSTFSKVKHVRVYSYFCDAMIFPDGVLWREG